MDDGRRQNIFFTSCNLGNLGISYQPPLDPLPQLTKLPEVSAKTPDLFLNQTEVEVLINDRMNQTNDQRVRKVAEKKL